MRGDYPPLTPPEEVAAIRAEDAEWYGRHDLWDAADEYDLARDNPTRPNGLLPVPREHKHEGCGHLCRAGLCGPSEYLCALCDLKVHK